MKKSNEINKKVDGVEEVEETKTNVFTKAKNWVKTNGKKIAAGAAVVGVGVIGYALGKRSEEGDCEDFDIEDLEPIEMDYSEEVPE